MGPEYDDVYSNWVAVGYHSNTLPSGSGAEEVDDDTWEQW